MGVNLKILFDSRHIQQEELKQHIILIEEILRGELTYPQVKMLKG